MLAARQFDAWSCLPRCMGLSSREIQPRHPEIKLVIP